MEGVCRDLSEYAHFTGPMQRDKAINMLKGIMSGIKADRNLSEAEMQELAHWSSCYLHLMKKPPFLELGLLIEQVSADGIITFEESLDILWLCDKLTRECGYYNLYTHGLQELHGFLHGIMADNQISKQELEALRDWLDENQCLAGLYPYDEVSAVITDVLVDGVVSKDEEQILKAVFGEFVDAEASLNLNKRELAELRKTINVQGICAMMPTIEFNNSVFCFTGLSTKYDRNTIAEKIFGLGGIYKDKLVMKTDYLVVGAAGNPCWAFACYGRKVEQAVNLRKKGHPIIIVHENDFWDAVMDFE